MTEHIYTVAGMTCAHCAAAVATEVNAIPAVEGVEVDLVSGRLEVCGEGVDPRSVRAAVEEAGYSLV